MKCPNCGAELKEGTFYCEDCGYDIHIVPDFEPELELNMEKSLGGIRKDVGETDAPDEKEPVEALPKGKKKSKFFQRAIHVLIWIINVLLVAGIAFGGLKLYQNHSLDYQVSKAEQAVGNEQYDKAIGYYTRAIELDRHNIELKFDLAEVYFKKNDKKEYEYLLSDIVQDSYTNAEQLESAYGKLIAIYKAREDYKTISDILTNCKDEAIRAAYQGYLAQAPEFSAESGTYDTMTPLKLTVTGKGSIYYTIDGSEPNQDSEVYTAPILLEKGRYVVKAFFVNENGIASDIVSAEYRIEVEELEAPELNVESGDYSISMFITITNDHSNVYYTMDGSEPTLESPQYVASIPMPLGVSRFRFVRLEGGKSSTVVERTFDLKLKTDFSVDQAVEKILNYSLESGKITDEAGHFDDTEAIYRYQYLYVVNINDIGDFYIIAEVLVDAEGTPTRTGNYFAVNAYSGYYYKVLIQNSTYTLVEIE